MSLRRLIYLFSTVWLLVILLIINVAIYFLFYKITTNGELNQMTAQTENIAAGIKSDSHIDPADLLGAYLPANGMIRVINKDAHPILTTTKNTTMTDLPVTFESSQTSTIKKINGETYGVVSFPVIWDNGQVVSLEVTEDLHDIEKNLNALKIVLIASFFIIIIPSFLGGRILGNILLKPINSMIETMNGIQKSGMFKKIPLRRKHQDELYKMGETFNHTMDILESNFEKQKAFVSDASHELKTPLTVIESYASLLKRWGMERQDILEESIDAIYSETIRMKEMTRQMLKLAENTEDLNLTFSKVNLAGLCEKSGRIFENAYRRKIHFETFGYRLMTKADESRLKQLLFILLDNAYKYSTEAINLKVGKVDGKVFFSVEDHGVGIPENQVEHVFERFYRVDKARSRQSGGTGLGMAIAKQIVDAHRGSVQLKSEEGVGTTVTVFLPIL